MLGVLRLVGVVIQSDEVEAGLDLIAAPSEHVLPAHTLSRERVAAVDRKVCFYSSYLQINQLITDYKKGVFKRTYC